ncbi:uncharacterized protein SCHCODRAFT_02504397 [Schizophyllum commune H4-8]|nr:uncharacterized protein SCHCODRAFT_02504397 [Schizophyllum commune H4-8]KAI5891325.1 hypothetical protein SCHCODRAFT_02504397 [Schizophyllum commune H4-8]
MQPTLDPLPNQPTRFSQPSSVEEPGPHYLKKRAPHQEGWCRCLHRSVDAPTPAMSMPPLQCRYLDRSTGAWDEDPLTFSARRPVGRPSSHESSSSGARPLMTAYSRPSTVLLPLPLCRYAVVRGGSAAVRGAPGAVICSHILP